MNTQNITGSVTSIGTSNPFIINASSPSIGYSSAYPTITADTIRQYIELMEKTKDEIIKCKLKELILVSIESLYPVK